MNYVSFINNLIKQKVAETEQVVLFGQNINAGSCLSGYSRGIKTNPKSLIFNSTNTENCLVGMGFGCMLNGVNAVFLMKQLDFLLLGIDQIVNTYNYIRLDPPKASFSIMPVTVDCGYQGLQSSANNLGDFCSIARVPGYTFTNAVDSTRIINEHMVRPGFRILAGCQRLFGSEILNPGEPLFVSKETDLFHYKAGNDATIVAFNYSFPQAQELWQQVNSMGRTASLFSINSVTPTDWTPILSDLRKTKKLVVLNDSKSENLSSDNLVLEAYRSGLNFNLSYFKRDLSDNSWLFPNPDVLELNYSKALEEVLNRKTQQREGINDFA